eukprot:TRINITY_DN5185_c0_g1_i3.p1 TRINITY_DN5185_c0_g1~~TRINITY_DN5185_c0_g1_i3.p1  ORF type:complete len:383 (-),score=63.92 TRINITY_DN5185_c0_g1_i3:220-1368(-)
MQDLSMMDGNGVDEENMSSNIPPSNSRNPRTRIFAFLCLTVFLDSIGLGLIIPSLNTFNINVLHADGLWTGLIASSYSIGQLIGSVVFGKLSDMFGRKKILLVGLIGTSISYVMLSFSYSLWYAVLSRFIGGLFAVVLPLSMAFTTDITSENERIKFIGIIGASMGGAIIVGTVSGGGLATFGFFVVCLVSACIDAINVVLTLLLLKEPQQHTVTREKIHLKEIMLVLTSQKSLMILFAAGFLYHFAFATLQSSFMVFVIGKFKMTPLFQGLNGAMFGVTMIVVQGFLAQWLKKRIGEKKMAIISSLALGASLGTCFLAPNLGFVIVFSFLIATSNGFLAPAMSTLVTLSAKKELQGLTIGIGQAFNSAAGAIAPNCIGISL